MEEQQQAGVVNRMAKSSHRKPKTGNRKNKMEMVYVALKYSSPPLVALPSARTYFLNIPKLWHKLGTNYSNICPYKNILIQITTLTLRWYIEFLWDCGISGIQTRGTLQGKRYMWDSMGHIKVITYIVIYNIPIRFLFPTKESIVLI